MTQPEQQRRHTTAARQAATTSSLLRYRVAVYNWLYRGQLGRGHLQSDVGGSILTWSAGGSIRHDGLQRSQ